MTDEPGATAPFSGEPAPAGQEGRAVEAVETGRIREVYAARDRRSGRSTVVRRGYELINDERRRQTLALIRELAPNEASVHPMLLDVGCGSGLDLAALIADGWPTARLAGVDLVPDRIASARERCPGVWLEVVDGARLPFETDSIDVVSAVTVFSSILDPASRRALFAEMTRVASPSGIVLVYDFVVRNPRNRDVIALPMHRLEEMAGRRPDRSVRLSPLLYTVGLASAFGTVAERIAMSVSPRTHRLSVWTVDVAL